MWHANLQATVLEVKQIDGLGMTVDVLVVNEQELARLFGIQDDSVAPWGRDVFIDFTADNPVEQRFTFKVNPKYFVSVNLRFNL